MKRLQEEIWLTRKRYQNSLDHARKPSPMTLVYSKPRNNIQLSDFSNETVSIDIYRICGCDYNVSVTSLENGGHIVTLPPKRKSNQGSITR
jgi:hypothetical protein